MRAEGHAGGVGRATGWGTADGWPLKAEKLQAELHLSSLDTQCEPPESRWTCDKHRLATHDASALGGLSKL